MKVYGIKNCDTIKKACKYLESNQTAYEFIDLKSTSLTVEIISKWLTVCGIVVVNKRSTTYRNIKTDWLAAETVAGHVALIQMNPTIIKRPLIEHDDGTITVGFPY